MPLDAFSDRFERCECLPGNLVSGRRISCNPRFPYKMG